MARTSSIYDHFIIWPSSVTLALNLTEQMFQMTLLLLKENNCAILFWSPWINVEDIARTSSIIFTFSCDLDLQPTWTNVSNGTATHQEEQLCQIFLKSMHKCRSYGADKLNLLPFYHLTFKCDLDLPHTWVNVSNGTATSQGEQLCKIIWKSMHNCRSYGWDKRNIWDHQVWHWPSTYLKCFKWLFSASRRQLCQIILKSMHKCRSYGLDKSGLMHARTHTHTYARTHIHPTKIVTAMSRFTASGLDKNYMWLNIWAQAIFSIW